MVAPSTSQSVHLLPALFPEVKPNRVALGIGRMAFDARGNRVEEEERISVNSLECARHIACSNELSIDWILFIEQVILRAVSSCVNLSTLDATHAREWRARVLLCLRPRTGEDPCTLS